MKAAGKLVAVDDYTPAMDAWARTDHRGYVEAVVRELAAVGIASAGTVDVLPGAAGRAMGVRLGYETYGDNDFFEDSVDVVVEWDEERGWTLHDTHELGALRGYGHGRYGLGLGVVPEPAAVARHIKTMFEVDGLYDDGNPRRRAIDHDPLLEAALARHLADGVTDPRGSV